MRARRPRARSDVDLTNGPGKLCLALAIGRDDNLARSPTLSARDSRGRRRSPTTNVVVTPRIGITRCADWPLRYFVRDNP